MKKPDASDFLFPFFWPRGLLSPRPASSARSCIRRRRRRRRHTTPNSYNDDDDDHTDSGCLSWRCI